MKNLILISFVLLLLTACGSSNSTAQNGEKGNEGKVALDQNKAEVLTISATDLKEKTTSFSLLDVRTPEEWADGIMKGAEKLNFRDANFRDQVSKLDRSKSYVVYCAAGGRSSKAAQIMVDLGFKSVHNLDGGMGAWKSAGGETVLP